MKSIKPKMVSSLLTLLLFALIPAFSAHARTFPEKTAQQLVDEALKGGPAEGYVDHHDVRIKSITSPPAGHIEVRIDHISKGIFDDHHLFWMIKRDDHVLSVYEVAEESRSHILFPIYLLSSETPYFSGDPQEWINYPNAVERGFQKKRWVDFYDLEYSLLSRLSQAL